MLLVQTSLLSESLEAELRLKDTLRREFEDQVTATLELVAGSLRGGASPARRSKKLSNSTKLDGMMQELLKARKLIGEGEDDTMTLSTPVRDVVSYTPGQTPGSVKSIALEELANYSAFVKTADDASVYPISPTQEANLRAIIIEVCHNFNKECKTNKR